jgi:hypothetical protein
VELSAIVLAGLSSWLVHAFADAVGAVTELEVAALSFPEASNTMQHEADSESWTRWPDQSQLMPSL